MPVALLLFLVVLSYGCGVAASDVIPVAQAHVLWCASAVVLYGVFEALKGLVPQAPRWRLFWRLLPLWPVFVGAAGGGLFPGLVPADLGQHFGLTGSVAGAVYFAAAGVLSTHLRDLAATWAKHEKGGC